MSVATDRIQPAIGSTRIVVSAEVCGQAGPSLSVETIAGRVCAVLK